MEIFQFTDSLVLGSTDFFGAIFHQIASAISAAKVALGFL